MTAPWPATLVSGGQTGVDRAALDAALELGIPHGGWCPHGRRAEDGPLPARYLLRETPSPAYAQRTRWNVRDADGTLLLLRGEPGGGTALTLREARSQGRPVLCWELEGDADPAAIHAWLAGHRIGVLNVAGPRESESPGIYDLARRLLLSVLAPPGGPERG